MKHQKFKNVISLNFKDRYDYFIRKVCDFEQVWSLKNRSGWATLNVNEEVAIPFWPEKEFAEDCAHENWEGLIAEKIELKDFLMKWLEGMHVNNQQAMIFMTSNSSGTLISPLVLKSDLELESEQYE